MKMVPAVPRLQRFYNTVHVQCSNISLIIYLLHISKCFPQLFTACLKPKYFTNLPLPTQSPNPKHPHTCYGRIAHKGCTVFPPFCLQKEKHTAFVFPIRSFKHIHHNREVFKGIPQIFSFLLHASAMKSDYKNYFYPSGSALEC